MRVFAVAACLFGHAVGHDLVEAQIATPQGITRAQVDELLDKGECANFQGVKVCKYDFSYEDKIVEAITFLPTSPDRKGPHPGLILIPGHDRTARDQILFGNAFARGGFVCMAVSQPGYGKSEGTPDFVGPTTIKTLTAAYDKFRKEPYVDGSRMGIYGYSRGGMAASLLAVLPLEGLRGVVLGGGIYDFEKAYQETPLEGIRENMKSETGMTAEAMNVRSSLLRMDRLHCPILIFHGEKDVNAPVSQAHMLRNRLTELRKPFEIHLFPDKDHSLDARAAIKISLDFFERHTMGLK
ncbi:MAG: prolyl oligopeptidase family serine peptidase, partial [Pirellula sp.]